MLAQSDSVRKVARLPKYESRMLHFQLWQTLVTWGKSLDHAFGLGREKLAATRVWQMSAFAKHFRSLGGAGCTSELQFAFQKYRGTQSRDWFLPKIIRLHFTVTGLAAPLPFPFSDLSEPLRVRSGLHLFWEDFHSCVTLNLLAPSILTQ